MPDRVWRRHLQHDPAGQSTINTVAIGSGWTTVKDMFIWGGVFAILAVLAMTFVGYPIGALLLH